MSELFLSYQRPIILSCILLVILLLLKLVLNTIAHRVGKRQHINIMRIRLMFQYINVLIVFFAFFLLLLIWGVEPEKLALVFSSVFAVIGVALFAIWSILSNITSGVIMYFSFPYKIGDKIKINDKDYPIVAVIEDIRAFHLYLRDDQGELITYPNNLILQKPVSFIQKDAFIDEGKDAL